MPDALTPCPVHRAHQRLRADLETQAGMHPRSRRLLEEAATLIQDIVHGRGGEAHLNAIRMRLNVLSGISADDPAVDIAKDLSATIDIHHEVFNSHIKTRNCASGDCDMLVPAPCQMACPAGIDVPTYVSLIAMGRDAEAIDIIRRDNPLPWVCGLVCTRPCEFMCVRDRIDTPVAIKSLKAFAAEQALSRREYDNPRPADANGHKVCIIGAGPAGLSAAYYLALRGYQVRVIEALPKAGGMLLVGIPRYRLPEDVIDHEVAKIEQLGVEFCFDTYFGFDVTFEQLRSEGFEAFFLALGAHNCFSLNIPGEHDFPRVRGAVTFLREAALGMQDLPGEHVVVIGGGNVAIDAARTCLRLGSRKVTLAYRRTRDDMPADREEVEQAQEEGVHFEFLTIPVSVEGEGRSISALRCMRAEMVKRPDADRRSPRPIKNSEFDIPADAVISAIGQRVERQCLNSLKDLNWTHRDTVQAQTATMATSMPGVFAGGDMVTGPATVIEAIGAGKKAAQAIDRFIHGLPQPQMPPVPVRRRRTECIEIPAAAKIDLKRPDMPLLHLQRRRTTFQQVELGLDENMARKEARRCLRCDICRRCGRCVEVCRHQMGVDALAMGYFDFDAKGITDFERAAQRCIGCGACAANCPTGAMMIEDRGGERILSLCGTILSRQPLLRCDACSEVIGTQRYLDFIQNRVSAKTAAVAAGRLCIECARKKMIGDPLNSKPII